MKETNYSLLPHNTFGMDVKAKRFIEYSSVSELRELASHSEFSDANLLHIGGGSNLLFTKDFDGTVVHSAIKGIKVSEAQDAAHVCLTIGAGEVWDEVVEYCVEHEYYGAENLSLIPGETGAAAVQNIGAYGVEMDNIVASVEAFDIKTCQLRTFSHDELQYAYRDSMFKMACNKHFFVTSVSIVLSREKVFNFSYKGLKTEIDALGTEPTLRLVRDTVIRIRENKLPSPDKIGSAGSFFMNPKVAPEVFADFQAKHPNAPFYELEDGWYKVPAGWLIDQCGWKGKSLGKAGVYENQALVLVNRGGATGAEVVALAEAIVKSVVEKFGEPFRLKTEVNIF
jgi:UDP-N-acetylmuramate dehydrogenase